MSSMGRRKTTASTPLTDSRPKSSLVWQAVELANMLEPKGMQITDKPLAARRNIDIVRLERAIRRYRRALALQATILDELEEEVKSIKQNAAKKATKAKNRK